MSGRAARRWRCPRRHIRLGGTPATLAGSVVNRNAPAIDTWPWVPGHRCSATGDRLQAPGHPTVGIQACLLGTDRYEQTGGLFRARRRLKQSYRRHPSRRPIRPVMSRFRSFRSEAAFLRRTCTFCIFETCPLSFIHGGHWMSTVLFPVRTFCSKAAFAAANRFALGSILLQGAFCFGEHLRFEPRVELLPVPGRSIPNRSIPGRSAPERSVFL